MKIRIGNDFRYNWLILWNEEAESFTDATDKRLTVTVYGRVTELVEGTDYTITGNTIAIDFTPAICDKTGSYNLALQYTKPSDKFIDGDRRSAVDVDAFIIVPKSEQSDSLEDITHTSDAVAMFLDVAYQKLDEIEAAEAVRETAEEGRVTAEQQRAIDSAAAVENANDAATYANEQGAYAEEMSAHPPVIIADYWHNWNFTTNQYESTGQYARGDSAVEGALVVQETGQSAVNTMSQKAVTDELVQLASDVSSSDFTINIKELPIQSWENAYIDGYYVMHESSTNEISGFIKVNEGWNYTIATNRNTATVNAITFYESATQESIIPEYRVDKVSVGMNENNLYNITIPSGVNYIRINNYPTYKQKAGVWCKSNVIRCSIKDTALQLSNGTETLVVEYETSYFIRLNRSKLFYITSIVNSTTAPCYYDKYFKFISSISGLLSNVRTPIYPVDVPEDAMYIRYSGKPINTMNPLFAGEIEGQDLMQIKDKDFWSFDLDSSFYNTSVKIPISYRKKGTQLNIITDSGTSMLYLYKETDFGNTTFGLANNWSSFYSQDYIDLISDIIVNETNVLVSFDSSNRPIEILHKRGVITIRTDIIVYRPTNIEETRTLNTGRSLRIKTVLETLATELTWS